MKRKAQTRSTRNVSSKLDHGNSIQSRGNITKREEEPLNGKCDDNTVVPDEVISNSTNKRQMNEVLPVKHEEVKGATKVEEKPIKRKKVGRNLRPTPAECEYVTSSLSRIHPEVVDLNDERRKTLLESCGMRECITDAIISTMLSQNTTDANAKAAFKSLKTNFKSWEDVASCNNVNELEDCIRVAGLAKTRAERIQALLRTVRKERGIASLEYIKDIPLDDDVKTELSRFKGLGPKTISCVLLFALGRPDFPVDTHVLRITKQMNWVHSNYNRESAYEHLNKFVPNHLKLDLHCLLVRHGKCCHKCASRGRPQFPPKDGSKLECPLDKVSSWNGIVPRSVNVKLEDNASITKLECKSNESIQ